MAGTTSQTADRCVLAKADAAKPLNTAEEPLKASETCVSERNYHGT